MSRNGIKSGHIVEISDADDHLELLYPLPSNSVANFRGSLKRDASLANELIDEHKQEVKRD